MLSRATEKEKRRSSIKAVLSGIVGLRTRADFERDVAGLSVKQLIFAVVVIMATFVSGILTLVHFITH